MKSLREFLEDFLFNHEFGVAPVTVECYYKPAISDFSKFLGRDALVSDLNRESVNRWIISKQEAGCPGSTIRTRRSAILALWRGAWVNDILREGRIESVEFGPQESPCKPGSVPRWFSS